MQGRSLTRAALLPVFRSALSLRQTYFRETSFPIKIDRIFGVRFFGSSRKNGKRNSSSGGMRRMKKPDSMKKRASKKRKIIVSIATSADGFIARPDGDVGWLDRPRVKGDYGMGEFFKTIDTILWGRKTYTKGLEMGMKASTFPGVRNYVFSRSPQKSLAPGFEYVKEPIQSFIRRLRQQAGKHIWMMGGGEIIGSFLDEGEIDEFSIHVIPVFIGEGIPLIQPKHRTVPLDLLSTKKFSDGVAHLNYRVRRKS
jgi:dihydrofolate reductase